MKNLFYIAFVSGMVFISCGRRTVPQQTTTQPVHPKVAPDRIQKPQYVKKAVILDSNTFHNTQKNIQDSYNNKADSVAVNAAVPVANSVAATATVVIDSHGMLQIDSANLPPDVSHNLDSLNQATRAFTPNQVKNLAYRFKEIPPRVLLVPDTLAKKGVKGYYYKYDNKFWYWKKDDGYFYLDENYYQ
ncbi:hypothetical protein A9P82_05375 [Arachidicoccus ginsenosidimutans]|uniref:hypothetical protein n=1 Tax=Arachidicoccus sp. BS20 TaxID=1850526 RepID=UPI0007F0D933|nr:hypothetical protein [Arachidicoccus sp. BS20]ANI88767.1 hypothetical protein A9P82_05375 [Arachidicoccus sp. BS20]